MSITSPRPSGSSCTTVDTMTRADALPMRVAAGLVWTTLSDAPFPRLPEVMEDATLDRFWWTPRASAARVLDAVENHLDPAHPHHVHPWIVRAPHRRRRTLSVARKP